MLPPHLFNINSYLFFIHKIIEVDSYQFVIIRKGICSFNQNFADFSESFIHCDLAKVFLLFRKRKSYRYSVVVSRLVRPQTFANDQRIFCVVVCCWTSPPLALNSFTRIGLCFTKLYFPSRFCRSFCRDSQDKLLRFRTAINIFVRKLVIISWPGS